MYKIPTFPTDRSCTHTRPNVEPYKPPPPTSPQPQHLEDEEEDEKKAKQVEQTFYVTNLISTQI